MLHSPQLTLMLPERCATSFHRCSSILAICSWRNYVRQSNKAMTIWDGVHARIPQSFLLFLLSALSLTSLQQSRNPMQGYWQDCKNCPTMAFSMAQGNKRV